MFDDSLHHSLDKSSSIIEVVSTIREDIVTYCNDKKEMRLPPKVSELEMFDKPDSVKLFLTSLLGGKGHSIIDNKNINRLIDSYAADIIQSVMRGKVLTKKHYLLAMGLHSMIGSRNVITVLNKMGHCMTYNNTCEIETALAEATLVRSKEENILPILPVGDEIILTYFWVDNFDVETESRRGNGSIHTTHLMAFQESSDGLSTNTNNMNLTRTKRRKISTDPEFDAPLIIVDKNQEPPNFNEIVNSSFCPNRFTSLYLLWLCFRKWNSHDQTVPTFSGWLIKIRKKQFPSKVINKTTETYLPPIVSKVTDFASIHKYVTYLQSLATSVNMPYVNITLDVGAAMNVMKFLWNDTEEYRNVIIHLGSFHFIKENFQVGKYI